VEVRFLEARIVQGETRAFLTLGRDPLLMHRKHFF
jgi:hypothetical protein